MSSRHVFCGVPIDDCKGSNVTLNAAWNPDGKKNHKNGKLHSSHEEAFKCYCAHLQHQGYQRLSSREFSLNGGPVLVIDKASKFGSVFRKGKEGDKSGSRFTPMRGRGAIVEKIA
jgi:hypothetical protein